MEPRANKVDGWTESNLLLLSLPLVLVIGACKSDTGTNSRQILAEKHFNLYLWLTITVLGLLLLTKMPQISNYNQRRLITTKQSYSKAMKNSNHLKYKNLLFETLYSYFCFQVRNGSCWRKTRNGRSLMRQKDYGRCTWKSTQITNTGRDVSRKRCGKRDIRIRYRTLQCRWTPYVQVCHPILYPLLFWQ